MTALILEGWSHYGTGATGRSNMLDGPYAEVPDNTGIVQPSWDVPSADLCYSNFSNSNNSTWTRRVLPTPGTHFFASFRWAVDSIGSSIPRVINFLDGGSGIICSLFVSPTGVLALYSGSNVLLGSTTGPVVVSQNWHFFELEINTSSHTFTLRVDDATGDQTPVLSITNAAITGTIAQYAVLQTPVIQFPIRSYIKDFFFRDAAGTVNNGWLGDRRIATLFVNSDTTTAGWTPRYYSELGTGILNTTSSNACISAATATSLNIGAGDFTIEQFVRFQALPTSGSAVIAGKWDATNNQRSYQLFLGSVALNGGSLCFQTSTAGTSGTITQSIVYPWTPNLGTWYHIAIVRAAGQLLLFVDGQQLGLPITDTSTYFAGTAPFSVAAQVEGTATVTANTWLRGWIDEHRFTVGYARYTSNFTPTTVKFGRNVTDDPQFANVALLCGFDTIIQDESSFVRTVTSRNSAVQQTVTDGPTIGAWSTLNKPIPDDNTFIEAPYINATNILTLSAQPAVNDTVTVGTKSGPSAAVYKFVSSVSTAFDVLIDTTLQGTLQNLYNAINVGPGIGTKYGAGTTVNIDVVASQLPAGQMLVIATTAGTVGNSIASTTSLTNGGGWTTATLTGGLDIPGPSDFGVQRPPINTTIISAAQATYRAFKSDAGLCSIQSAFIGPLGGADTSTAHNLTTSVSYYQDIYETDPDTSSPISPTTIVNGRIRLNRVT